MERIGDHVQRFVAEQTFDMKKDWSGGSWLIKRRVTDTVQHMSIGNEDDFKDFRSMCESPIEVVALAALIVIFPTATLARTRSDLRDVKDDWMLAIIPQMAFGGYRLDFGVINKVMKTAFALECDGRDYHQDKRKDCDRAIVLWKRGIIVSHVSGSALCRDPIAALEPFGRKVRGHE